MPFGVPHFSDIASVSIYNRALTASPMPFGVPHFSDLDYQQQCRLLWL